MTHQIQLYTPGQYYNPALVKQRGKRVVDIAKPMPEEDALIAIMTNGDKAVALDISDNFQMKTVIAAGENNVYEHLDFYSVNKIELRRCMPTSPSSKSAVL